MNIDKYEFPELKPLDQDSNWSHKYCHDVLKGNVPACVNIKLAAERHFNDLERDDIFWDNEVAESIVAFFKFVPITDGKTVGQPTLLLPWQIWVICSMVSWRWSKSTFDDDGNPITVAGERRFLQAVVLIARKAGKTTIAAGVTLWLMLKAGHQPRGYCVATKRDQAKLLWQTAKVMIDLSPRLRSMFETRANEILMPNKHGVFKPLASDSNSLDGLNPIVIIGDEGHQWKDPNLYTVCVSSFGAQTEYLMLMISTAGFLLDNILVSLVKNGEQVLRGSVEQDHFFYAIFQMDKEDDWTSTEALYKANAGAVYGLPSMRYLKNQLSEAQMSTESKGAFLTKHLNIFVNGSDKWLDVELFKKGSRKYDIQDFKHKDCYVGFDRSNVSDITSASVLFPADDGGVDIFIHNLQSDEAIKDAGLYLSQIYNKAEASGDLQVLEGGYIRNEAVKELIREIWRSLPNCKGIFYDPYHMKEVALDLEEEGIAMISVSMGINNVSEPSKKLEGLIKDGLFRYNESGLLEYAASCAMLTTTKFGNNAVYRDTSAVKNDRIDPLIATILALSGATLIKLETNIYEERGMIVL